MKLRKSFINKIKRKQKRQIMKKLLTIFALAALTITATFATSDKRDIKINGSVKQTSYTFSLAYNDTDLSNGSTIEDSFDLSKVSNTDNFIVKRTSGNLNDDLVLSVSIEAGSFIGEFNGNENYDTNLEPEVNLVSTGYTYSNDYTKSNLGGMDIIIPAGANLTSANLAEFYLAINGNSSIPAGSFVSTVLVNYTYGL